MSWHTKGPLRFQFVYQRNPKRDDHWGQCEGRIRLKGSTYLLSLEGVCMVELSDYNPAKVFLDRGSRHLLWQYLAVL